MRSEKLSYPGIAGAVAGVVALLGVFMSWFEVSGPNGSIRIDGTAHSSGKLAFAMSIALFAFSVGYVLLDDRRIRRSMAALVIASSVIIILACLLGLTSASDGTDLAAGFSLSVLGGLLGVTTSPIANGALVGSTAQVWAEDGTFVASGGQLMLCRPASDT